jgi:hypothetical protein
LLVSIIMMKMRQVIIGPRQTLPVSRPGKIRARLTGE